MIIIIFIFLNKISKIMKIYIEGNIGSGKSTFAKLLQIYTFSSKHIIVQEPVDEWLETKDSDGKNILDKFYCDIDRWSFTFQMNSFISRAHKLQKSTKENDRHTMVFCERSIYSDKNVFAKNCYENGKMTKMEYDIYCRWNEWLSNEFSLKPQAYIYLKCNPNVNSERIVKRARNEEENIPLEYLEQIHQKHEEWFINEKMIPTFTIDATLDFTKKEIMDKMVEDFKEFLNEI